ncbi:MAG: alpha/beta hydrolase [Pseudomonadota bacterium]
MAPTEPVVIEPGGGGREGGGPGEGAGFIPSVYFADDPGNPCSADNQLPLGAASSDDLGWTCLKLFFATNRALDDDWRNVNASVDPADYPPNPASFFTDDRYELVARGGPFFRAFDPIADDNQMPYETYRQGAVYVTVPKRAPGDRLEAFDHEGFFGRDIHATDKNRRESFTIQLYELLSEDAFWNAARDMKALSQRVAAENPDWVNDSGAALIYVHGFNASFAGAAYRTAQLTYDLKFAGVPLFFSWPANSEGNILKYLNDVSEGTASVGDLKAFLKDVHERLEPTKLIVIAHSHGNQVTMNALNELSAENPELAGMIDAMIFASPDVDAVEFKRVAERIGPIARSKTLYTSSNDRANSFRTLLTNLNPFAGDDGRKTRAGYFKRGTTPVLANGVTTIDVTNACVGSMGNEIGSNNESEDNDDRLKHSKYADARDLIRDMREMIDDLPLDPAPPPHRRLDDMVGVPSNGNADYWRFEAQSDPDRNCG